MKTAHKILQNNADTKDLFDKPPRVTFRKADNLKDILVHPKLPVNDPIQDENKVFYRCKPCKKPRCGTCKLILSTNSFTSNTTGKTYPVKGQIDCNTENVVYKLTCKHCPKEYIGETTTPLRIRMTNHRFDVTHSNKQRPISAHAIFHKKSFEDCFTLTGVRKVTTDSNKDYNRLRLQRHELSHILLLKTKTPQGLNLR